MSPLLSSSIAALRTPGEAPKVAFSCQLQQPGSLQINKTRTFSFFVFEKGAKFLLLIFCFKICEAFFSLKDENVKVDKSVFVDSMSTSFAAAAGFEPWTFDLRVTVHNDIFILQYLAPLKI